MKMDEFITGLTEEPGVEFKKIDVEGEAEIDTECGSAENDSERTDKRDEDTDKGSEFEKQAVSNEAVQTGNANEEFTLKYLGQELQVGAEKLVKLAQKGMDYDRIRERYERLKTTAVEAGGNPLIIRRTSEIDAFVEDFPDVKAADVPQEVWSELKSGKTLSEAYLQWENERLKREAEAGRQNQVAGLRSTGSRSSSGSVEEADEFARELLR
jgi:hypothetical protein